VFGRVRVLSVSPVRAVSSLSHPAGTTCAVSMSGSRTQPGCRSPRPRYRRCQVDRSARLAHVVGPSVPHLVVADQDGLPCPRRTTLELVRPVETGLGQPYLSLVLRLRNRAPSPFWPACTRIPTADPSRVEDDGSLSSGSGRNFMAELVRVGVLVRALVTSGPGPARDQVWSGPPEICPVEHALDAVLDVLRVIASRRRLTPSFRVKVYFLPPSSIFGTSVRDVSPRAEAVLTGLPPRCEQRADVVAFISSTHRRSRAHRVERVRCHSCDERERPPFLSEGLKTPLVGGVETGLTLGLRSWWACPAAALTPSRTTRGR